MIKKYGKILLGCLIGSIAGYLYWQQVGCSTGSCPITSSPFVSTLYGMLIGGLFGSFFNKPKTKEEK